MILAQIRVFVMNSSEGYAVREFFREAKFKSPPMLGNSIRFPNKLRLWVEGVQHEVGADFVETQLVIQAKDITRCDWSHAGELVANGFTEVKVHN